MDPRPVAIVSTFAVLLALALAAVAYEVCRRIPATPERATAKQRAEQDVMIVLETRT